MLSKSSMTCLVMMVLLLKPMITTQLSRLLSTPSLRKRDSLMPFWTTLRLPSRNLKEWKTRSMLLLSNSTSLPMKPMVKSLQPSTTWWEPRSQHWTMKSRNRCQALSVNSLTPHGLRPTASSRRSMTAMPFPIRDLHFKINFRKSLTPPAVMNSVHSLLRPRNLTMISTVLPTNFSSLSLASAWPPQLLPFSPSPPLPSEQQRILFFKQILA